MIGKAPYSVFYMPALMVTLFLFVISVFACKRDKSGPTKVIYPRHTGDIKFDDQKDDSLFMLCNADHIWQYFNLGEGLEYEGEKYALMREFQENYSSVVSGKSGLIRIRFIVNCHGKTDRFRLLQMNFNYEPVLFEESITEQLLTITSGLRGWIIKYSKGNPIDYYQYLIFKMEKGKLIEIMP